MSFRARILLVLIAVGLGSMGSTQAAKAEEQPYCGENSYCCVYSGSCSTHTYCCQWANNHLAYCECGGA